MFTKQELSEIFREVKQGKSSKEIAILLNIPEEKIEFIKANVNNCSKRLLLESSNNKQLREEYIHRESPAIYIKEWESKTKKISTIQGIAGKADIVNKNNRIYSLDTYKKAIEDVKEKLERGALLGEIDHPGGGEGSLKESAVKFKKLWIDGDLLKFECEILKTPAGDLLQGLILSNVGMGVSTRGYGKSKINKIGHIESEMITDYELIGIDFVVEGSNPYSKIEKFEKLYREAVSREKEEIKEEITAETILNNNEIEEEKEMKQEMELLKEELLKTQDKLQRITEKDKNSGWNRKMCDWKQIAGIESEEDKAVREAIENKKWEDTCKKEKENKMSAEEKIKEIDKMYKEGKLDYYTQGEWKRNPLLTFEEVRLQVQKNCNHDFNPLRNV